MRVKPNRTVVRGRVSSIRKESDGWGAQVELQVLQNESPSPEEDFLRPEEGSTMTAFLPDPAELKVGDVVRAAASLNAGPFGGRSVIQSVERLG